MFYTAWTHLLNRHSVTVFDRDRCFFSFHPPKWPNLFEVQNVLQLPVDRPITFFTLKGQSSKVEKCKNQFFVLTLPQVLQFALRPNYSLLAPLLPRSIFKVERSKVKDIRDKKMPELSFGHNSLNCKQSDLLKENTKLLHISPSIVRLHFGQC